jgi:hypothetical protein
METSMAMEDFPDHPLDLNKIVTLPPSEWIVSPCGDGSVIIGAWVKPYDNKVIKRLFRFTEYPAAESSAHLEKS